MVLSASESVGCVYFWHCTRTQGLDDLSAVLSVTYDLTLAHPASYLQLVVGLKAPGHKALLFFFLSFFSSPNQETELCNTSN